MEMPWSLASAMLLRWFHVLGAILWVGLLFFVVFVQPRLLGSLESPERNRVLLGLGPRLSAYMTGGAVLTVVTGLVLGYMAPRDPPPGQDWLGWGIYSAFFMFAAGMFISGPLSRKVLDDVRNGKEPDPLRLKILSITSSLNVYLSVPVVFLMVAGSGHFSGPIWPWMVWVFIAGWTAVFLLGLLSGRVPREV